MESSGNREWRPPVNWQLPVGALIGGILSVGIYSVVHSAEDYGKLRNYTHTYEKTFTDPDECLHNTPYDPANKAFVNLNTSDHQAILSVMPQAANFYNPSVLSFTVGHDKLTPADHITAGFLERSHCQGLPSGT